METIEQLKSLLEFVKREEEKRNRFLLNLRKVADVTPENQTAQQRIREQEVEALRFHRWANALLATITVLEG